MIFPYISHVQTKCGKYLGISHEILLVSQNIVMDMNNAMIIDQGVLSKNKSLTRLRANACHMGSLH